MLNKVRSDDYSLISQQLAWLNIVRLIIIIFLSISAGLVFFFGEATSYKAWVLWWLIIASYIATFGFHIFVRLLWGAHLKWIAVAQIVWDIALATALVYITGGPESAFTPVY